MQIYIGAALLIVVIILSILLIAGLPLGELTMGGKYKVWPGKLRLLAVSQLLVQIFALYILLSAGGIAPVFISMKAVKITCIFNEGSEDHMHRVRCILRRKHCNESFFDQQKRKIRNDSDVIDRSRMLCDNGVQDLGAEVSELRFLPRLSCVM